MTSPEERTPTTDSQQAEARAVRNDAVAVDSEVTTTEADDRDDPGGGDTSGAVNPPSTEAPHPVGDEHDPHAQTVGRGADGDREAVRQQKEQGGP
jgi:hypothetical protein